MKLMDKIKNLFLDEEEEDIEEEEFPQYEEKEVSKKEYKEPEKDVLPKVMRETIEKEEPKEEPVSLKITPEEFVSNEPSVIKNAEPSKKFNFPIDFEDELPSRNKQPKTEEFTNIKNEYGNNINVLSMEKQVTQKVAELYPDKEEEKVKPRFKASPVISPVYGVLDKNYTKEEVKEKDEEMVEIKRPSKKVDFETVRKKAFGNLTDEIKDNLLCENCELYKEVQKINALKEDDLLYDMTVDDKKDVTIEKAYDNYEEFGVAYEPTTVRKKQEEVTQVIKYNEISVTNKEPIETDDEETPNVINDEIEEEPKETLLDDIAKEMEQPEKIPTREEKKKETKVDDDFFELIDSMYKERVDE